MDTTNPLPTRGARLVPGGSSAEGGQGTFLPTTPVLDVVIPVHNEERDLEPSVRRLRAFLDTSVPWPALLRQALVFGAIGVVSTLAYAVLYLWLRSSMEATPANALALVATAIANTAANRRLTFGVRGSGSMLRDQVGGFVALGIALVITSASIDALDLLAPDAARAVELAVLIAANAAATVTRFFVLRSWISHAPRASLRPAQLERTVR
jgi:putative flippase GtrA